MSYTDNSQTTRTKQLSGRELFMFQTLNPHAPQGGQNGFSHEHIVEKNSGSIVSGEAVASLRPVRIADPPSPPTIVSIIAGPARAIVYVKASTQIGSPPTTSYTVTSSPGGFTATRKTSPITVTGLTNGVPYTFSVVATSSDGSSSIPIISSAVTPADYPDAPTVVSVSTGNGSAAVYFTAPANNGGAPITTYQVVASSSVVGGGKTVSGTASPITVTGLTNAIYTFRVYAINKTGFSAAGTSAAVTIVTVPGAPTAVSAYPEGGKTTVSFTAPANTGGVPIIDYTVTSSPGGFTATGAASPLIVYGQLTIGIPYTFSVYARNNMGISATGTSGNVTLITTPGAPTMVSAIPEDRKATVSFTAPANTGGVPIIDYTVTSSPGGFTATGAASPLIVAGLTNGTPYTFSVYARNRVGNSPLAYTNAVAYATVPGPPTGVFATVGDGSATVFFSPPESNGGDPVTSYTITSTPVTFTINTPPVGSVVFAGLTNGRPYSFKVVATNSKGSSPPATIYYIKPSAKPGAPTAVSAIAGNESATVSFTAPANIDSAPGTTYSVVSSPGGITVNGAADGTVSPIIITGLTNGIAYTFNVYALNPMGSSISLPSNEVTPIFVDQITASLTTSLGAYQAAATDAWVKITAEEYTALQTKVPGTTKAGIIDDFIPANSSGFITDNKSILVANSVTVATPAIPANNYLYAFAISWDTTAAPVGMRVYSNTNKSAYTGFNQVGGALPATSSRGMSYYVRKSVTITNGATEGLLACFSGTRIDYPDAAGRIPGTSSYDGTTAPAGSGGYIGFRKLQGTGYSPIPNILSQTGSGNVPIANSTLQETSSGIGPIVLQGLVTPNKEWN